MTDDEALKAGRSLRRRVNDLVARETADIAHGREISAAVHGVVNAMGEAMYALSCRVDAPMAERVPGQQLALRLIREALSLTEADYAEVMAKSLEARS